MHGLNLLVDLVLAATAGLVGGLVARRLGQPVILGYLLAGVALGPFTPGPTGSVENLNVLAEAGVALLMFALGAESSLGELRRVGRVAVGGGVLQILGCVALGAAVGPLLGLGPVPAIFFGALTSLSSTVVSIKLLLDRAELGSLHGRIALGLLIVQDLALVPMMVVLPALSRPVDQLGVELARAAVVAAALLGATLAVGARVVPWVLERVAHTGSRELFVLCVVALALGTALGTQFFGLSLAFGAFLAGLVVSESELSHQAVGDVLPLRDLFATLFFVSVGMLLDPFFLGRHLAAVFAVVALVVLGKTALVALLVRGFGYATRVAVLVACSMAQMGEFSFVLARAGMAEGLVDEFLYNLTLAGAVASIVVSPALLRAAEPLLAWCGSLPVVGGWLRDRAVADEEAEVERLARHTVICGYGRVGRELARSLERRGFRYLVVEYDPRVAADLRRRGVPVIVGDAGNPEVLRHANLARATVLAVTLPDFPSTDRAVRESRRINPDLDVIARAPSASALRQLHLAGATEVVRPEFEAGLEFVRHTLRRYGVSAAEVQAIVGHRRAEYYTAERADLAGGD